MASCYYRARYYDTALGRFIAEDPGGFKGRDVNFYAFVRNRPTRFIDPYGALAVDPDFRRDCLLALQRALAILRKVPKKCDCEFRKIGSHRTLTDFLADPSITVHSEEHDARTSSGEHEGGYTLPNDIHNLWIRPLDCRLGRWAIARTIVHELTHITLVPGPGQEDAAGTMEIQCGILPQYLPTSITVTDTPE